MRSMQFLCDEMCAELGKWLRAAGYDTEIVEGIMPDRAVFERAVAEGRLLITRDRDFQKIDPEGKAVIHLKNEDLDSWAAQLREIGVDWLNKPFSRCLKCNKVLEKNGDGFWKCPICDQEFWLGSHTENMEKQLKKWKG